MIDFHTLSETVLPQFNGGEGTFFAKIFNDGTNKILRGRLPKGASIGLHCHQTSSEVIFILSGEGKAILNGTEEKLVAGNCHYCPKGQSHALMNVGDEDLVFYAVVPQQ